MAQRMIFVSGWRARIWFTDGGDAGEDVGFGIHLLPSLFVGIVGADHDDGDPGLDAVKLAVFKTPEDVFGAVAADAPC